MADKAAHFPLLLTKGTKSAKKGPRMDANRREGTNYAARTQTPRNKDLLNSRFLPVHGPSHQKVWGSEDRNLMCDFEAEALIESNIFRAIRLEVTGGHGPIEILTIETH